MQDGSGVSGFATAPGARRHYEASRARPMPRAMSSIWWRNTAGAIRRGNAKLPLPWPRPKPGKTFEAFARPCFLDLVELRYGGHPGLQQHPGLLRRRQDSWRRRSTISGSRFVPGSPRGLRTARGRPVRMPGHSTAKTPAWAGTSPSHKNRTRSNRPASAEALHGSRCTHRRPRTHR